MNDMAQLSCKILFLASLALLIGMSVPATAQDPGNVGGPGAPTTLEGRGAIAPLPAPETPASPETALDTTPADEVRSLPGSPDENSENAAESADEAEDPDDVEPAAGPIFLDGRPQKPWWKFW